MGHWSARAGLLAGALLLGGSSAGHCDQSAIDPAARPDVFKAQVGQLIEQLADRSFAVRQRASKQLVEVGIAAQPLLTAALADDDAEVRNRCSQVLAQVVEADFRARLEAFANDPLGKGQHSLPSWNHFREAFGEDKVARDLFVEMQRAEPALLDALETNQKLAGELLSLRVQGILQAIQWPQFGGGSPPAVSLGTVCALLFVSGTDGVSTGDQEAIQLFKMIAGFQSNLRTTTLAPTLKKLVGLWILQNSGSMIAVQNLRLACSYDLKEGLDLAVKMIRTDGGGQPFIRQYVILTIGRFGNHEHIALLEPLLKDASPCTPQQNHDPRQPQIRDVALAVLIKLSGQELKDYGLDHIQQSSETVFEPATITFASPAKRDAALKRWDVWAQRHTDAKE